MRVLIRYVSYPMLVGGTALSVIALAAAGVSYWPVFPLIVVCSLAAVAVLERLLPYEPAWLHDHDDTREDIAHLLVSHALIQAGVATAFGLRIALPESWELWPDTWPMWTQVLLAGAILDVGLYAMHRLSHVSGFLWKLHTLHHSVDRLYWLNGGRRHPLSALVLASPGLLVLLALGATPIAIGAWMSIMSVHLAFQHANLDYRLGPMRGWLAGAETHRWHHKREYEDAQVNFGEVFLLWDRLFGTFHDGPSMPRAGDVGLHENLPHGYVEQLTWPFRRSVRSHAARTE